MRGGATRETIAFGGLICLLAICSLFFGHHRQHPPEQQQGSAGRAAESIEGQISLPSLSPRSSGKPAPDDLALAGGPDPKQTLTPFDPGRFEGKLSPEGLIVEDLSSSGYSIQESPLASASPELTKIKENGAAFLKLPVGVLFINTDKTMFTDTEYLVTLRAGLSATPAQEKEDEVPGGINEKIETHVSHEMEARLEGKGFTVVPPQDLRQPIMSGHLTIWRFKVTPTEEGHPLRLYASLVAIMPDNTKIDAPPFEVDVAVKLKPWSDRVMDFLSTVKGMATAISGTVLAVAGVLAYFFPQLLPWIKKQKGDDKEEKASDDKSAARSGELDTKAKAPDKEQV